VSTFSYPTWEQLPELDLYLDQVLLYVNKTCAPVLSSSDKGLTAAMINNYVKHGYVEKPDKKKYQRRQVARLIAITTLKTVFSIQEIASTLNFLQDQASSDLLYNSFVAYLNEQKEPIALMNYTMKLSKKLSFGEEIANSVTHAVGALLMLILLPISAVYSFEQHGLLSAFGTSIFVISLFLMFLSSTVYHAMSYDSPQKYVLRIIDHSMIYIAIAGSYTPVVLTLMNNWMGYSIILIQWGTTIFGILYKIFAKKVNEKFSLALYLIMGWLVIFIIPQIVSQTNPIFWGLMLMGGLCYTVGAGFYAKKKPYFHMIWHLFILAASALQYLAIVYFM